MSAKKEYGDFQTPERLATRCINLIATLFENPDLVIEPTVGLGAFLKAAVGQWQANASYEGYEINKEYVDLASKSLSQTDARIFHRDFFSEDWMSNLARPGKERILVIGNPPWVTNSSLGQLGSSNLPQKTNFQRLRGFDAITGKSNFDIAEWILIRLIEALPPEGALAMLCKTMTARKVLRYFWKTDRGREGSRLFQIDAKTEFDVSVDACLLFVTGMRTGERVATVYRDLSLTSEATRFGFLEGDLVSDIDSYQVHKKLDGGSTLYTWRSGIKHDAANIMEFTWDGQKLINGLGQVVEIESDYVFPLLKSSDLGNGRMTMRKAVLVTQRRTGDDTSQIEHKAPNTWDYLMQHADSLDRRKSSIYRNRPRFSVFGVGPYSFAPWKIAISALYKNISFVLVPPCDGRPVMVDDTCYSIPCRFQREAELVYAMLSSPAAGGFLSSLIFFDSKRPITIDILRRLSFVELARDLGMLDELQEIVYSRLPSEENVSQMPLLMEPKEEYRIGPSSECRLMSSLSIE